MTSRHRNGLMEMSFAIACRRHRPLECEMSDAPSWIPIAISIGALAVSVTGLVLGEVRKNSEKKERAEITDRQNKQEARIRLHTIEREWRNSILSDRYAVADDNWAGLLDRATKWRTELAGQTEQLLKATGGRPSRAYTLLQQTVEPAKRFETTIRPLAKRRELVPIYDDLHDDRMKIESAIRALQGSFDSILNDLAGLTDEELVEVVDQPAGIGAGALKKSA